MTSFQEINSNYRIVFNLVHKSTMIPKVHNPNIFLLKWSCASRYPA